MRMLTRYDGGHLVDKCDDEHHTHNEKHSQ